MNTFLSIQIVTLVKTDCVYLSETYMVTYVCLRVRGCQTDLYHVSKIYQHLMIIFVNRRDNYVQQNSNYVSFVELHRYSVCHAATFPAFIAREKPQVHLCVLFQAQADISVEPSTFCKLAEQLSHIKIIVRDSNTMR